MKKEKNTNYYFAYGSNLNLIQMKKHCPNAQVIGATILNNHRLIFNGTVPGHSFLNIEECECAFVPIGIYRITKEDEKRLDRYEGYPTLYLKKQITVPFDTQQITGLIYIMRQKGNEVIPSNFYYMTCHNGYIDFQFDPSILETALTSAYENQEKTLKYINKKDC